MINDWQEVLYWVTIASITIANIFAVRQQNLKRLMAFSSISQAGYIMLGVIGGTAQGMTALVYYVLVYAAANLGVFGRYHYRGITQSEIHARRLRRTL